jgi:serine/threonine-protein kinase
VRPENVLLVCGHALLTNLGLARALDGSAAAGLTDSATLIGTAAYMSPEQAEGRSDVDARSDVYSLAAVLFEMLTGEPLFSGPTGQAIMAKRAAGPTPTRARMATLPSEVAPILRKALARSRDDRFQTVGLFARALDEPGEEGSSHSLGVRSRLARLLSKLHRR